MASILVFGGIKDGKPDRSTLEMLGAAHIAAGPEEAVSVCLLSGGDTEVFYRYGVCAVYRPENPLAADCRTESYLSAFEAIVKTAQPQVVIVPGNSFGRDAAARLAFRLKAEFIPEVLGIKFDDSRKKPVFTRALYGGKAEAVIAPKSFPVVATLKLRTFDPFPASEESRGEEIKVSWTDEAPQNLPRFIERLEEKTAGIKLEDAEIVVSGGRGIGGPEGFGLLAELARLLKGAVGASRGATDAGWAHASMQIGQTGKTVSPNLYLAVGISGATQHVAGITGAKTVVAINKDEEAPIFKAAHLGIVSDYRQIVPLLIEKLKAVFDGRN